MSLFDQFETEALDRLFGSSDPLQYEVGLSTSVIQDSGTGLVEPSGGAGYARVTIDNDGVTWGAATIAAGVASKKNLLAITFPTATGNWGTIRSWFLRDPSSGLYVIFGNLTANKTINTGDIFRIPANGMDLTVD
jgi:hypothetical protein